MKRYLIALLLVLSIQAQAQETPLSTATFGSMAVRQIGPATMSGRISSLDALHSNPNILWVGAAGGGVWKSENGGTTFKPVFDKHTQSIGNIAIDQQHPDTVWVGTGEPWIRNSVSIGDGVYKTVDGGDNWIHLGLESTERIAKIIIHPQDPNIVYVAAMGPLWADGEDRGVYKTTDGGQTWNKILYVDQRTGASDLAMDSANPEILYAGMYSFRRTAYDFVSGGEGSGLYKSIDGGANWQELKQDLPRGMKGRIALSVTPANADIVYALIESDSTALFRSSNKGESWTEMNRTRTVSERPFYFSLLVADPTDSSRIYKPGLNLNVSSDGGKAFATPYTVNPLGGIHVDHHALWVGSQDNNLLYLGTDGGLYTSRDGGSTWSFNRSLPISQFYHVSADNQRPYNVYGGLQDNGSWMGPSRGTGGIRIADWKNVGGGDGFYVFPDMEDPNIVYWQSQGGNVQRFYMKTREAKAIKPTKTADVEKLRFNWNTPVHFGAKSKDIYIGAQYLYRSSDKGDTWIRISPDLTTNDTTKQKQALSGGLTKENTSAENHTTIITVKESPLNDQLIWVGTDDGNLQITRNGGKTWDNVIGNVPNLPANTWVSYVEASHAVEGRAFATFDGHRAGDMNSYVYITEDYGKTWTTLVDENISGYAHVIREDTKSENLLFLGTEFGLFISIDTGKNWVRFEGNMPPVAVFDMVIHPVDNDLVMATHGRGIFILDDITALRGLKPEVLDMEVALLPSRTYRIGSFGGQQIFPGDDEYVGPNPTEEAIISYYLKKRHIFGDMKVEVLDDDGVVIAELQAGKSRGINKVAWPARQKAPRVPSSRNTISANAIFGPAYPPGEYRVRVVKGDEIHEGSILLEYDPASPHSTADRELQHKVVMDAYSLLEDLGFLNAQLLSVKSQADSAIVKTSGELKENLESISKLMEDLHQNLVSTDPNQFGSDEKLREKIAEIYGGVSRFQGRPTQSQIDGLEALKVEVSKEKAKADQAFGQRVASINTSLKREGLEEIKLLTKKEYDAQQQ